MWYFINSVTPCMTLGIFLSFVMLGLPVPYVLAQSALLYLIPGLLLVPFMPLYATLCHFMPLFMSFYATLCQFNAGFLLCHEPLFSHWLLGLAPWWSPAGVFWLVPCWYHRVWSDVVSRLGTSHIHPMEIPEELIQYFVSTWDD